MRQDELNEPVLSDDYPVSLGYFYVADGVVIEAGQDTTVERLKRLYDYQEVRRCDIVGRSRILKQGVADVPSSG